MSPGLTAALILLGICTACALKPLRKPPSLSLLSYFAGMVVNEVPVAYLLYLVVPSVTIALVEGDVSSGFLWPFLALWVLLGAGLAFIWMRQLDARQQVNSGLDSALPPGWRSDRGNRTGEIATAGPGRLRTLCFPFPLGRVDVRRDANHQYGPAGRRNRLDLYFHKRRPQNSPVLIYFHGGHFRGGHKRREGRPLILRLASRGWLYISANYRLRPDAAFPDYVIDAKKVIHWTRQNAARFGGDPGSVFLAGSSAGGHIASIAALTAGNPVFQPGFEQADTSVAGFTGLYGYYGGLSESAQPSAPGDYIHDAAPPAFLAHGSLDTVVRAEGARRFAERLRSESRNPVVYVQLEGAQHGFDLLHSERIERVVDGIVDWTSWVRSLSRTG